MKQKIKKCRLKKARAEAAKMLDEIAADVKHDSLRMADRLLSWLWNKALSRYQC